MRAFTRFALPLFLSLLMPLAAAPALADPAYITITGQASVAVPPDRVTINAGVIINAPTARAALDQAKQKMTAVFAALKAQGVGEADIRTANINLEPQYAPIPGNTYALDTRAVTGYRVSNSISVTLEDVNRAGSVLDTLVAAGANQSGGINYSLRDDNPAYATARAAAVKDALARAQVYAGAANVQLGPIHAITDGSSVNVTGSSLAGSVIVSGTSIATPVSAGLQTLHAGITMSWEIRQ